MYAVSKQRVAWEEDRFENEEIKRSSEHFLQTIEIARFCSICCRSGLFTTLHVGFVIFYSQTDLELKNAISV